MVVKISKKEWLKMAKNSDSESSEYTPAIKWWRSLSINEQRGFSKKYFPAFDQMHVHVNKRLIKEIFEKENQNSGDKNAD